MKRFILLIAAMALMMIPFVAQADDDSGITQSLDVSIEKDITENTNVTNNKTLDVNIDADIRVVGSEYLPECGDGYCYNGLTVDGLASAEIKNNQILKENMVINEENPNTATIGNSALENAEGNIGVNVVAGDNNAQDNLVAIAVSEQEMSMADAMIFKEQLSLLNFTCNKGRTNSATLGDNALRGTIGNIGVNLAAGNNNAQSNMLAIASAPAKVGIAKVGIHQESAGNMTINKPVKVDYVEYLPVNLSLSAELSGGYGGYYDGSSYEYGWMGGNYSGGESGTTSGMSYQANNFYPDTWSYSGLPEHSQHPDGSPTGHIDMDYETQGAIDNPYRDDVGGLAFDNSGNYSGSESGTYSGEYEGYNYESGYESGSLGGSILGSVYGSIPVVIKENVNMVNNASLGGNALEGATGNIGVNIAAGTGNLQANALAVTYLPGVSNGGGNGGGEQ